MNPFKWLERQAFLGEVVHDYGVVEDYRSGIQRTRVSLLLCKQKDKFVLVIRESNVAFLGASVRYTYIHEPQIATLKNVIDDVCERVQGYG